jgi:hypothetical protein
MLHLRFFSPFVESFDCVLVTPKCLFGLRLSIEVDELIICKVEWKTRVLCSSDRNIKSWVIHRKSLYNILEYLASNASFSKRLERCLIKGS